MEESWVGVQVFACDVSLESDHVVIQNSRSHFKTMSSSRKFEGEFTPVIRAMLPMYYETSSSTFRQMSGLQEAIEKNNKH